jgi:membrane associated rhomboid family serine protease
MQIFIFIGLGFFIISGICVGAFTTGTQQRGNFYSESKQDRKAKKKVANWSALGGLISLAVAGILYLL